MHNDTSKSLQSMSHLSIRHPEQSEAPEIGALHNRVWRRAFEGFAPHDAFKALDQDYRVAYWQRTLDAAACQRTLVAAIQGRLIGMVTYGEPRHPDFGDLTELQHLYIDPDFQSRGLGRRLVLETVRQVEREALPRVALGVVQENTKARRFYASLGAEEHGTFTDPGPLWKSTNVRVILPHSSVLSRYVSAAFE